MSDRSITDWYAAERTTKRTIPLTGIPAFDFHPMGNYMRDAPNEGAERWWTDPGIRVMYPLAHPIDDTNTNRS